MKNEKLKDRAYNFSLSLLRFIAKLPKDKTVEILCNQLLRAGTSIGANIIEAQASSSKKDFTRYFQIALKSANETKYWLSLLKSYNNLSKKDIDLLLNEVIEISNMLGASILTLKGKRQG